MFDQRSLNLITEPTLYTREDYQRTLKILNALAPVIEAAVERLQYEWDKLAHIEIGDDTYVMKPNETGEGYTWEKIDYFDYDWYFEDETSSVEENTENTHSTQASSSTTPASAQAPTQSTPSNSTTQEVSTPSANTVLPQAPTQETSSNSTAQQTQASSSATPASQQSHAQELSSNLTTLEASSSTTLTPTPSSEQESSNKPTSPPTPPTPVHIDSPHWLELVEGSAIAPDIASANFKSLHHDFIEQEHQAWEYLMYSDQISRRNDGRLRDGDLERYRHIEKGGWWCDAGVDPRSFVNLEPGEQPTRKLWGCYKPNEPRFDKEKPDKKIKYEHPPKTNLSIFLLEVPEDIANKVYSKAGVDPNDSDRASGFWYCVWKHNIPVVVTEGAKKTAAILSQGDAAIGLPGINAGYRANDEQSNPIPPHLREEFAVFATPERDVKLCFDYEKKAKTKKNVRAAILKTGKLLEAAGAKVSVISLPGPEKGVDDLIVAHGSEAYQKVIAEALPLQQWSQQNPPPDLRFTIFLKNGKEINLYEKQADGTVTSNPADLDEKQISDLAEELPDSSPKFVNESYSSTKREEREISPQSSLKPTKFYTNTESQNNTTVNESSNNSKYWAQEQKLPNYVKNFPRKLLLQKENKDIALVTKKLIDQYGVQSEDGSLIYKAEAFTIRKFRDTYSIHRAADEKESYFSFPLMQFEVDKKDNPKITKPPINMLAVERQEFLNIINKGKKSELPSFYEDAITLKQHLGSLAPNGTQKTINNLQISEVSQLLTNILSTADSKHLQVGSYRIKSEVDKQTGNSFIKLIKTEKNQLERVAATFNTTTNSMLTIKLGEGDIENLRLIAKRVQVEYSSSGEQHLQQYSPTKPQTNKQQKSRGIEL